MSVTTRGVICCSFMFQPGEYDEDFYELDNAIDAYARSLDGFIKVETWYSKDGQSVNAMYFFNDRRSMVALSRFPMHQLAKSQSARWYKAYRIVVSEVTAEYGDELMLR